MKRKLLSLALLAVVFSFVFSACSEDSPNTPTPPIKEENYIIRNGKKSEIKFAAMGHATVPSMATALLFSIKDLNDPEFSKEENQLKLEIRDKFLGFVKEGEPDDFTKKSEFVLKGGGFAFGMIKGFKGLEFEHSFETLVNDYGGKSIYEIKIKIVMDTDTNNKDVIELRYKGMLKTGGTGNIYEDDLKRYTVGGRINKPKPPTPTPEPPTPTPEPPIPTPEPPIPSFHNIKFSGNGVVFEITPKDNFPYVTYPFIIKGKNMFLDKNLNGNKDAGEEIEDNFEGSLSLPKKDGKALFVLRGDIREIEFKFHFNKKYYYEHPEYPKIKESKFDASKCTTLEKIHLLHFSLNFINLSGCKSLKDVALSSNHFKTLDFAGLHNLENVEVRYSRIFSGKYDFSSHSKLKIIDFSGTEVSGVILPASKSCTDLKLDYTSVESIDLSNGENISILSYYSSVLKELDITPCNNIERLYLTSEEKLTKIVDRSPEKKRKLKTIYIADCRKLIDFNFSRYGELEKVDASKEIGVDVYTLINRLPSRALRKAGTLLLSKEDVEKVKYNLKLKSKNWKPITK